MKFFYLDICIFVLLPREIHLLTVHLGTIRSELRWDVDSHQVVQNATRPTIKKIEQISKLIGKYIYTYDERRFDYLP